MAEVHRLPELRREFITDADGSALRATWHREAGFIVLSSWRGDTCVATSHLSPPEAGRLATFITTGLADLAQQGMPDPRPIMASRGPTWRDRLRRGVRAWRESVGWSLERMGRKLR